MKLNEMIESSRKKNEKFDTVDLNEFAEGQFFGALNLKASKEGTGIGGAFANWSFDLARASGLDLRVVRAIGNKLQQVALDSKHSFGKSMKEEIWYQLCRLKSMKFNDRTIIDFYLDSVMSGNGIPTKKRD